MGSPENLIVLERLLVCHQVCWWQHHAIVPGAFPKLHYLKMDTWVIAQPGAMPRLKSVHLHVHVRVLKFGNFDFHDFYRLRYLRLLEKVHVRINCLGAKIEEAEEAEAALRHAVQSHPNRPRLILNRVGGQCVDDKQVLTSSQLPATSVSFLVIHTHAVLYLSLSFIPIIYAWHNKR
jgi:hypothetical protein